MYFYRKNSAFYWNFHDIWNKDTLSFPIIAVGNGCLTVARVSNQFHSVSWFLDLIVSIIFERSKTLSSISSSNINKTRNSRIMVCKGFLRKPVICNQWHSHGQRHLSSQIKSNSISSNNFFASLAFLITSSNRTMSS